MTSEPAAAPVLVLGLGNMLLGKKLMERVGISPTRLRLEWISAAEGARNVVFVNTKVPRRWESITDLTRGRLRASELAPRSTSRGGSMGLPRPSVTMRTWGLRNAPPGP